MEFDPIKVRLQSNCQQVALKDVNYGHFPLNFLRENVETALISPSGWLMHWPSNKHADNGAVPPCALKRSELRGSDGLERFSCRRSCLCRGIPSSTVKIFLPVAVSAVNNSISLRAHSSYRPLDVWFLLLRQRRLGSGWQRLLWSWKPSEDGFNRNRKHFTARVVTPLTQPHESNRAHPSAAWKFRSHQQGVEGYLGRGGGGSPILCTCTSVCMSQG